MKKNLLLLLVLIAIALFFFWDRAREEKKKEQEEQEKQLFTIKQDQVKEIIVVNKNGTFKAVKDSDRWNLTQPFETAGDKNAWDNLARTYADGKLQESVAEKANDLKPFGLTEPKIQVSLAGVNGATQSTLLLGDETPVSGKYYALVKGSSDVVTVYSSLYSTADKQLFDLRDKTILDMEADQVQKVEVACTGLDMSLEKHGTDEWQFASPIQARADESKVRDLINKVRSGQIKQFIEENPENLAAYGLINPATKLVFWTGQPGTQSSWAARALLLGGTSASETWYAKREGQKNVFTVAPTDFKEVPKTLDDYRMKKVTAFRSWDVSYLKLASGGAVIVEATKSGGDWMLLQPQPGKANYASVSNLVRDLTDLQVANFVQGTTDQYGLDNPEIIVELGKEPEVKDKNPDGTAKLEKEYVRLKKGPAEADQPVYYYGARVNPLEIYGIPEASVAGILDKAKQVKLEAQPTPVPAPVIQSATAGTPVSATAQ